MPPGAELSSSPCDAGKPEDCSNLGYAYEHGIGVAQDQGKAAVLYKKACDDGVPVACNNLARMYDRGEGVPEDEAGAARLWQKACVGGVPESCYSLGWMYGHGAGVARDQAKSAELYKKACDGGVAAACAGIDRAGAAAAGGQIGVPECDEYLTKYEACVQGKVPESVRATFSQSMNQMRDAWKQAAATSAGKAALATGCKQALAAAKQAMTAYGCQW